MTSNAALRTTVRTVAMLLWSSVIIGACDAADIKVITSPGMRGVFKEIAPQFERASGHTLILDFAVIAISWQKIAAGELFDLTIVSPELIDDLIQQGKIVTDTRTNIGRTGLGAISRKGFPKPDISSVDAVKRTLLGARSVGYPAAGASGTAYLAVLERLGISREMKLKSVAFMNPITAVETGQVELGVSGIGSIITASDVGFVGGLPPEIQVYVSFTSGISTAAKEPEVAKALTKYLTGSATAPILKLQGLEPF